MCSRGVVKWPDGRMYTGTFKNGLEDGLVATFFFFFLIIMLTSPTFYFLKYFNYCFLCSFGDYVVPNKNLNSCDHYQGQCKDGKMHGFGTFRFVVVCLFLYIIFL